MEMTGFEKFDQIKIETQSLDRVEKMKRLNESFHTSLKPELGAFGVKRIDKGNGVTEALSRNDLGHVRKDYYQDGVLIKTREKVTDNTWKVTKYDDNGTAFLSETSVKGAGTNTIVSHSFDLAPNVEIVKGNISVKTDSLGRPISNKIVDLEIVRGREELSSKLKDAAYRDGDQRGHLIADIFGGHATKENIVPQLSEVNQSQFRKVENHIKGLKEAGHKVDYEVKTNYVGKETRPSSFEFKITVDGEPYNLDGELKSLRKIYNDSLDRTGKAVTTAREGITSLQEVTSPMHRAGVEQGLDAAKLTFAISTVDNTTRFLSGEITADEMVANIAKDTGTAGAIGYGTGFVSNAVAKGLEKSSSELLKSLGKTSIPTAAISFGIESYDSVMEFAQGKIDGAELAYDLGDNASNVAGGMYGGAVGAKYGAMIGTAVAPGAGTAVGAVAGSIVGGMVGCAVASGAYETAVEAGSSAAAGLGAKAEQLASETIDYAEQYIPDAVGDIKASINTFAASNNLPFSF